MNRPRPRREPKPCRPGEDGFTVLELLAVVVILAAAAALSFPRLAGTTQRAAVHASAVQLAAALRATRTLALWSNTPATLSIDTAKALYASQALTAPRALAPRVTLSVIGGRQDPSGHAVYFDFTADGHATGGRITLSDGRQAAIVVVDWLTGSAAVETPAP